MRPLLSALLMVALLTPASSAFAGDLNAELKKSQVGMKKFFDPYEKKIHDAGPQVQGQKNGKKKPAPAAKK